MTYNAGQGCLFSGEIILLGCLISDVYGIMIDIYNYITNDIQFFYPHFFLYIHTESDKSELQITSRIDILVSVSLVSS
jgi:hypothetical protein